MQPRLMPVLTLIDGQLYRTSQFKMPKYVGDPINAVKIFNEKMVDELIVFDIGQDKLINKPSFYQVMEDISSQAFMPISYGGGIKTLDDVKKVFDSGFEKIILNTCLFTSPEIIPEIATIYGSQSVVVSLDAKKNILGSSYHPYYSGGRKKARLECVDAAKRAESLGAGEIIIRDINRDGLMDGMNCLLISKVSDSVSIPVVAAGGAWTMAHVKSAISAGAHSVAAGNMFVYQGRRKAVLINYPTQNELKETFSGA